MKKFTAFSSFFFAFTFNEDVANVAAIQHIKARKRQPDCLWVLKFHLTRCCWCIQARLIFSLWQGKTQQWASVWCFGLWGASFYKRYSQLGADDAEGAITLPEMLLTCVPRSEKTDRELVVPAIVAQPQTFILTLEIQFFKSVFCKGCFQGICSFS